MIVNELRGEKVDIVPYAQDPREFVAKALSPAEVKQVIIDEDTHTATVVVPERQLSLAIGKEGQNARLAARLTGWRVDIQSDQPAPPPPPEAEAVVDVAAEEQTGEAVPSEGTADAATAEDAAAEVSSDGDEAAVGEESAPEPNAG